MAITLTVTDIDVGTTLIYAFGTVAFSGSWVMRGYAAGGTEFSTGSYPSSATGDKVVFAAQFRRLT